MLVGWLFGWLVLVSWFAVYLLGWLVLFLVRSFDFCFLLFLSLIVYLFVFNLNLTNSFFNYDNLQFPVNIF